MKKIIGWVLLMIVGFVLLSVLAGAIEFVFKVTFWEAMLSVLLVIAATILVGVVGVVAMYLINKD